jgi:hypothetical protein
MDKEVTAASFIFLERLMKITKMSLLSGGVLPSSNPLPPEYKAHSDSNQPDSTKYVEFISCMKLISGCLL